MSIYDNSNNDLDNGNDKIDWPSLIDTWGAELLYELGHFPDYLPTDYNPITSAIKSDPNFVAEHEHDKRFNRTSISRLAAICQMIMYDHQGGPEGDSRPKALRRHWYAWYKVNLAIPLSLQYGDDPNDPKWGLLWAGRLSTTYANFVDKDDITYKDLWVEDGSRMIKRFQEELFRDSNIIIAVEKDSLFPDFEEAGTALGAKVLYSGKGKSSKAAIEKVLRENFHWPGEDLWRKQDDGEWTQYHKPSFTADTPLVIIHISDYDYDGEKVIGPTFGTQARRYTPHILEARVGINPNQLEDKGYSPTEKWYQVKVKKNNKAYIEWAERKALFLATCTNCGRQSVVKSVRNLDYEYTPCCQADYETIDIFDQPAHGFEVEAMRSRDYRSLLVDALLQVLPFDYIVEKLRDEMTADEYEAVQAILREIQERNESYGNLLDEVQRLENVRTEFEYKVSQGLSPIALEHRGDFRDEGDDPEVQDFVDHVERGSWGPWRPFDIIARTQMLVDFLNEDQEDAITEYAQEIIEW